MYELVGKVIRYQIAIVISSGGVGGAEPVDFNTISAMLHRNKNPVFLIYQYYFIISFLLISISKIYFNI